MRICIFGAGAIGALMGGKLAAAGHDVTLIARGAHGEAMARNGLRLEVKGEVSVVHPRVTSEPSGATGADYVILTMKAHGVPTALAGLGPVLGRDATVVLVPPLAELDPTFSYLTGSGFRRI